LRQVGEAIFKHRMIEEGDRILIALSGGKDSVTLAHALSHKKRILPMRFKLTACHIITDMAPRNESQEERLDKFLMELGIELNRRFVPVVERSDSGKKINCFYCAMQRRMAILDVAKTLDCNKVAYGHHLDDIIETLLLNMFYKAEISTMPARLELDSHDIVIVRPLCLTKESETAAYARRFGVVSADSPCPYGNDGRRAGVKKIIAELSAEDDRVRDNISAALGRVRLGYLREKLRGQD
jgi:tRNA 2-thiocytidine biosynthesis protein TtcA